MPLYRRNLLVGGTYFFTVNLQDRESHILTENFNLLSSVINEVKDKHPFLIRGWVVLPNHLHCMWTLPDNDSDYSSRWRKIKTRFSWRLNTLEKSPGRKIWQNRYWEHTIRDQIDFINHLDYMHFNPVKHGFVDEVYRWRFSSYHYYVSKNLYSLGWGANMKMIPQRDS